MTALDPRECENCKNEFTPTRKDGKYCPVCVKAGKNRAKTKPKGKALVPVYTGLPAQAAEWDYDDLVRAWSDVENFSQWVRGDLAALVDTKYAEGSLAEFANDVGLPYNTVQELRRVAKAWPEKSRRLDISWSVHAALASQDDREEVLASRDTWTVAEARQVVKERADLADALTGFVDPDDADEDQAAADTADEDQTVEPVAFVELTEGIVSHDQEQADTSEADADRAVEARKALAKAASWLHDAEEHIGWITDPAIVSDLAPDVQAVLNALNAVEAARLKGTAGMSASQE